MGLIVYSSEFRNIRNEFLHSGNITVVYVYFRYIYNLLKTMVYGKQNIKYMGHMFYYQSRRFMSIVCHQAPKYMHTNMYQPVLTLLRSTWCILIWVWQYVIVTYVLYRNKKYIWHCVLSVMLSCTSGWLAFETQPWHMIV